MKVTGERWTYKFKCLNCNTYLTAEDEDVRYVQLKQYDATFSTVTYVHRSQVYYVVCIVCAVEHQIPESELVKYVEWMAETKAARSISNSK